MKKKVRIISLFVCIAMLIAMLALAITACGSTASTYYLSLASEGWQTYNSGKNVPEKIRFEQKKGDKKVYTLEVDLDEGEEFIINKVGSKEKIGFSALFSTESNLVNGENDSFKVTEGGTFALRLDVSANTVTYTYMPAPTSVTITASASSMDVGDVYPFAAEVVYSNGTKGSNVIWSSSSNAVATVSENGVVTAIAGGTVVITATAGNYHDSVTLTVRRAEVPVTGVTLDRTELLLDMGESVKLVATVQPENADMKDVFWAPNDESIVTVSNDGVVTAVGYGSTIVTVTTANGGFTADCRVTVVKHATALKLSASTLTLVAEGNSKTLEISFAPTDVTDKSYSYEVTAGSEFVSVEDDGEGILTIGGLAAGKATIVVISSDNRDLSAVCEIEVLEKGSIVAEMPQNLRVMIEESVQLTVSLENDAEIAGVSWAVKNEGVATVSGSGSTVSVIGVAFGSTTVTATVKAANGATYEVTSNILVADEFYFIYGYGLGGGDWVSEGYLTDQNAAKTAELLLEERSRGIYSLTRYLTPDNGFQIIFPNVANYTDPETTKWNKNIPSELVAASVYYDSSRSDSAFISNKTDQFCVNTAGFYTITLDLTGTSAKVYFKNVSVDVTNVALSVKSGSVVLNSTEEYKTVVLSINVSPISATFTANDLDVWISSSFTCYSEFVGYALDFNARTITVTVKKDPTEDFVLKVHCAIAGFEGEIELSVFASGGTGTPVSTIDFEEQEYYFNVNNGGAAWEQTVRATVNSDASVQAVKYSIVNTTNYFTVNEDTGVVTATRLGTVTIRATAVGDESKTAYCTITFYSDTFYIAGEVNELATYDTPAPSVTSIDGTQFESYKFTMHSYTYFTLEREFEAMKEATNHAGDEYGFQVVFLGMDVQWTSIITGRYASYEQSTYFDFTKAPNTRVLVTGIYVIEVDLSGVTPRWTINWKGLDLQEISLKAEQTALKDNGETKIRLSLLPSFVELPDENGITWNIEGDGSKYVVGNFDFTALTYGVSVVYVEHDQDVTVVITCSIGNLTSSVVLTIFAKHHLVQNWDNDYHWYECTDDGCNYTEGRSSHKKVSALTSNDPRGHYSTCEDCDVEFGFEAHSHTHTANYWANGSETCDVCGFAFFTIEGTTLVKYSGSFEQINIPASITVIGASAFEGHSEIISITLPTGLTTINGSAFKDCSGILYLLMPDTLTTIGDSAFNGVKAQIIWGSKPSILHINGFDGYLGTSLSIPTSVVTVDRDAFAGSNLTSIIIPDSVTKLNAAFDNCKALVYVVIGSKVTSLGTGGFKNCTALEFVFFKSTGFYNLALGTFAGCTSIKAVYFAFEYTKVKTFTTFVLTGNEALKGHCYAYADSNPGTDYDYNYYDNQGNLIRPFSDYFVDTWHWDSTGNQNLENIVLWNNETPSFTAMSITLFVNKKRGIAVSM